MAEGKIQIEICTDSVESGLEAVRSGATRIELCANLFEGGTTPSAGCIKFARQKIKIPIHVLLRPRGGDFCYSDLEFQVMLHDLELIKKEGCDGVVLGILNPNGSIDMERNAVLLAAAYPLSVTFHRAFDMAADPFLALENLITLGVPRLLTSGQEKTALEGSELISHLIKEADNKIIIMPGGGITANNISRIKRETNAREFHLTARKKVDSRMEYRNNRVSMGGELRVPEFELAVADSTQIAGVLAAV